ncbi:MAG: hypothetical protein JOZ19_10300 [Rubrobacter sp.]|nr:hypothetical protein [Rubrobacter sp.]
MSLELVLGLTGVLVGGGALIFAFLAWLNSRKSVKSSEEIAGDLRGAAEARQKAGSDAA